MVISAKLRCGNALDNILKELKGICSNLIIKVVNMGIDLKLIKSFLAPPGS